MSHIFTFLYIFLALMLSIVLINCLAGPFLRRGPLSKEGPLVSVLIPARNEAHNINLCLQGLRQQGYPRLEILVLDDFSDDNTSKIVNRHIVEDSRITILKGETLPPGWTGKNWACFQLAQKAKGKILIFTDADNRHHPDAVSKTVGWMKKLNLGGFSAFPQQRTGTFFEKLVIPVVDVFVYGMLPLWLTYLTPFSSLSAANGQWIAFRREIYQKIGGHRAVCGEIVEDVALARLVKTNRIPFLTAAGTGMVRARMYHSARDVWEGLSKNLFGLVGYSMPLFIGLSLLLLIAMVAVYPLLAVPAFHSQAALAIAINILFRALLAWRFRHSWISSVLLHPLGILTIVVMGINSVYQIKTGRVRWKGRRIVRREKNGGR